MRRVLEFIAGNAFLAVIAGAMAGAFLVLYAFVVWLDLPELAHGALGIVAVVLACAAGAFVAWIGDRIINRRPLLRSRARARR